MTDIVCDVGAYSIQLLRRVFVGGVVVSEYPIPVGGARLQSITYGRALDTVTTATVTMVTAGTGDCCGQLKMADHWNTDLIISYEGEVKWRGTLTRPVYGRGIVTIEASDLLVHAMKRKIRADVSYVDMDVSDIAANLWNLFVALPDPPAAELLIFPSGVRATRQENLSTGRIVWNVLEEMLNTGLDVTAFGSRIIIGIPPFTPITLDPAMVVGETTVTKDGDEYANSWTANAADDIQGQWPPGPPVGTNGYPLVEGTISDSSLQNNESAVAAARARYEFAEKGIRRVAAPGGLQLLPGSKIVSRDLIAGQLITFAASHTCYDAAETLRLGSITITMEAGVETTMIELQPAGSAGSVDSI